MVTKSEITLFIKFLSLVPYGPVFCSHIVLVLHDDTFQPHQEYSLMNQNDLLTDISLRNALSFGTEQHFIKYSRVIPSNIVFDVNWGSSDIIITIGECSVTRNVIDVALAVNRTVFAIDTSTCSTKSDSNVWNSVPYYLALESRRYQCMMSELSDWIHQSSFERLDQTFKRDSSKKNFNQSYKNCIGEQSIDHLMELALQSDTLLPELPYKMQSEAAKKFLNGRKMTVAVLHRPPFNIFDINQGKIVKASGFCMNLLELLSENYNFTYNLVLSYDGNWGNPMKNGTFNGMVGMVQRKEVDFSIGSASITEIRETVIDFTHAFYEEPSAVLLPALKERQQLLAFLQPYTWQVWVAILIGAVTVSPIMWLMTNYFSFSPLLYPFQHTTNRRSIYRYLWDIMFSLLSQSLKVHQTSSSRVPLGIWWMTNIVFIYTYSSILIAFLTVPVLQKSIENLEQLSNQKEILWTYTAGTFFESVFGFAEPPGTFYKIGELLRKSPNLLVPKDEMGIKAVLQNDMAYIKGKSYLDFAMEIDYLESKECRLSFMPQMFFNVGFGIILQEESVYLPLFNHQILRMMESGLLIAFKKEYWPNPNECTTGGGSLRKGPKALQIKNLYGHFLILALGFLGAFIVLIVEKLCMKQ